MRRDYLRRVKLSDADRLEVDRLFRGGVLVRNPGGVHDNPVVPMVVSALFASSGVVYALFDVHACSANLMVYGCPLGDDGYAPDGVTTLQEQLQEHLQSAVSYISLLADSRSHDRCRRIADLSYLITDTLEKEIWPHLPKKSDPRIYT